MLNYLGLPVAAAQHAPDVDSLISVVHWLMLVLFVGWGAFFVFVLFRFRKGANPKADYHGAKGKISKALEIGMEFGLHKDEIQGIDKALSGANNPDAIDLSGREIVIKLREDGTFAPKAAKKDDKTKSNPDDGKAANLPPVDTGRGSGANRIKALDEKIDAIDPNDPNAEAELAKLYAEVQQEQKRFEQRASRR